MRPSETVRHILVRVPRLAEPYFYLVVGNNTEYRCLFEYLKEIQKYKDDVSGSLDEWYAGVTLSVFPVEFTEGNNERSL